MIEPQPGGAYIWSRGKLRPIPDGASFGLPGRLRPLLRSRLLSPAGGLGQAWTLCCRPRTGRRDPSVADLVRPVSGPRSMTVWLNPLLGSVHAGDPGQTERQEHCAGDQSHGRRPPQLYLTMRSRRAQAPKPAGAPLVSIRRGMGVHGGRLVKEISPQAVLAGTEVSGVERTGARLVHLDRRRSDFSRGTGSGGARLRRRGSARTTCA